MSFYYPGLEKYQEAYEKSVYEEIQRKRKEKVNKFNNSFIGRMYWLFTGKTKQFEDISYEQHKKEYNKIMEEIYGGKKNENTNRRLYKN